MRIKSSSLLAWVVLSGVMCASTPQPAAVADSDITVVKATACRAVAERKPVESTDTFTTGDERAYVWCQVTNGAGTELRHVYYHEGAHVVTVPLPIRSDDYRTWSYKTLWPGAVGAWRVDMVTGEDTVLATVEFTVTAAGQPLE